jgi:hypothetical protein
MIDTNAHLRIFMSSAIPKPTKSRATYACFAALFALSSPTLAEVICVSTPGQLRTALSDAAASASATEIRIRKGFYALPAATPTGVSLQYAAISNLKISGGWDGNANFCTDYFPRGQEDTVLSADGMGRLMSIFLLAGAATEVELTTLSFRQGNIDTSVTGVAACLNIESDVGSNAIVRLDRNSFRLCNRAGGSGSALSVQARSADIYMRGNLLLDNANVSSAVLLQGLGSSTFYVSNNSIGNNPQLGIGGGPGGLQITGQASDFFWLTNNVLWNNGTGNGFDLLVASATPAVLNSNFIGKMPLLPTGVVNNGTLSGDPGFESSNNLRPRANSNLRDSGVNPVGGALNFDFDSNSRVFGVAIDRGAFEFTNLFDDGFE